jgi:hypothetical protein
MTVEQIAAEVREQNELFENGDKDRAFWIGQANRLKAMKGAKPELSQRAIGELVGKSEEWVRRVLKWSQAGLGSSPDWGRGSHGTKAEIDQGVTKALEDPARRKQIVREAMSSPEAAEVIADALEDPDVVQAVQAKVAETPTRMLRHIDAKTEADRRLAQMPRPVAPPTREQVDAKVRERQGDLPTPPPDPWGPFWQAIRLLGEVHNRVHPGMWEQAGVNEMNAAIARAADEQAEFLTSLAETARQKVAGAA